MAIDYATAVSLASTIKASKDDVPDGLWDEIKEARANFRETDRGAEAQQDFANDVEEICNEYGFPLSWIEEDDE
jgi:hypothetical protein